MRYKRYLLGTFYLVICLYFGSIKEIINYEKIFMKEVCDLSITDMEREKLLMVTHPERHSLTLEAQTMRRKTSVLGEGEWNNLFSLKYMDEVEEITCKDPNGKFNQSIFKELSLFYIEVSDSGSILRRNETCFDKFRLDKKKIYCNYSYIELKFSNMFDEKIHYLDPIYIADDENYIRLDVTHSVIDIMCTSSGSSLGHLIVPDYKKLIINMEKLVVIYHDILMYIPRTRLFEDHDGLKPEYSVIIYTIDSTSRSTFQRNMPLTTNYLRKGGAGLFQNHHRLAENSYPNVIPTLTGQKVENHHKGKMDNITSKYNMNWGWRLWKDHRYLTMYHEDMPDCSIFNHHLRTGWIMQPTKIYHRHAYLAMNESGLRNQGIYGSCLSYMCINNTPLHVRQLDLVKMLAKTYCTTPYIAYFHVSEYSHSRLNMINNMDHDFLNMLQDLDLLGCLNKTLLIIMGDHGIGGSPFFSTEAGKLDSNTPLLLIRLPEQLKQKHPNTQKILINNQNKMTTMLDIYQTFTDPIITNMKHQNTNGLSLLHPLPVRTCLEASIPPIFCSCSTNHEKLDPKNSDLIRPSQEIMLIINRMADNEYCAQLQFDRIDLAFMNKEAYHIYLWTKVELDNIHGNANMVSALFCGVFNAERLEVESVSREDYYHPTSQCIEDIYIKPFCICNKQ